MKIYRENKLKQTIILLFMGIVLPGMVLFLVHQLFNIEPEDVDNINMIIIGPFIVTIILLMTQYSARIMIDDEGISRISSLGHIQIKWDEVQQIKFTVWNKRIKIIGANNKKLYYNPIVINYKELYLDILTNLKLHYKEHLLDSKFIYFLNHSSKS